MTRFLAPKPLKRPKVKRRRRKGEITKLKAELWQIIRQIIIKQYGDTCYTCGKNGLRKSNLQVGHFITSSTCSTDVRYCLDNLRIQCFHCNINLSGNWVAYERHLIADSVDINALKRRNEETKGKVYTADWFTSKITEYQSLLTT